MGNDKHEWHAFEAVNEQWRMNDTSTSMCIDIPRMNSNRTWRKPQQMGLWMKDASPKSRNPFALASFAQQRGANDALAIRQLNRQVARRMGSRIAQSTRGVLRTAAFIHHSFHFVVLSLAVLLCKDIGVEFINAYQSVAT
jgi:hypothetical protein